MIKRILSIVYLAKGLVFLNRTYLLFLYLEIMLAKTFGGAVFGVDATMITVEVNVTQGNRFFMVGLADSAVKESQQRVESAIKEIG